MLGLVAFLGNYGREYEQTRHNTAWLFEASLPFAPRLSWTNKYKSEFCSVDWEQFAAWLPEEMQPPSGAASEGRKLHFMKPLTYMNLSGDAIGEAARFFKIPPEDILIVHDEIELPLGTVSLKWSGGLGGHNGLRSAKTVLGTADFWRLRFGIGKPANGNVADYVLGPFSEDEQIVLAQVFAQAGPLLVKLLASRDPRRLIPEWGKKKCMEPVSKVGYF